MEKQDFEAIVKTMQKQFRDYEARGHLAPQEGDIRREIEQGLMQAAQVVPPGTIVDMALLDPTGQNTAVEMKERLERSLRTVQMRRAHIAEARAKFDELTSREYQGDASRLAFEITRHIALGKADLSILDRSGQSNERAVRAQIDEAVFQNHRKPNPALRSARRHFMTIVTLRNPPAIEDTCNGLYSSMRQAAADIGDLVPDRPAHETLRLLDEKTEDNRSVALMIDDVNKITAMEVPEETGTGNEAGQWTKKVRPLAWCKNGVTFRSAWPV